MASIISGLGAGIDLQSIVSQLMTAERAPEQKMLALKSAAQSAQTSWTSLAGYMSSLRTAAAALNTPTKTAAAAATTSDSTAVTATATNGAQLGSLSLNVLQLATAQQLSSGALSSSAMLVGAGTATVTSGLSAIGGTGLALDSSVTAGAHRIEVTRASGAASAVGTAAPALDYAAGPSDLTVTTGAGTVTLNLGTYASAADLVSDLNTRLGGTATATLEAGQLRLSSPDEGSAAGLTLSGGALTAMGLSAGATTGTDALVSWDGASTTVTHVTSGGTATLATGVTLTTGAHLSAGRAATNLITTTSTSTLADLVSAMNASGSPVGAAVVNTGDGSVAPSRLVLTATGTGSAGALTLSSSGINVLGVGQLSTVTAAQDARLVVGGTNITRSTNTITDLLPGVTLGLLKPAANVSVGVTRDSTASGNLVSGLVNAVNALISNAKSSTAYNSATKTSGPLAGDSGARSVPGSLLDIFGSTSGTGSTAVLSQLGIQTSRDGTLTFDSAAFATRLSADPDGVSALVSSFAKKLEDYAKATTDTSGAITLGKANAGAEITRRQKQIDEFEVRMNTLQTSYKAKFAALDAALGNLKQQQTRLAGQINGLSFR